MLADKMKGVVKEINCGSNKWLTKLSGKPTTRHRSPGMPVNEEREDPSFVRHLDKAPASEM